MHADYPLVALRLFAVLAAAALLLLGLQRRSGILSRFAGEVSTPLDLAVARVVVMVAMLAGTRPARILAFAGLDRALIAAPTGWQGLAPYVPLNAPTVVAAYAILVVAALLALVGFGGRVACAVTAAAGLYLHTIPQLFGKVNHTANHLVLFSALLAVAPSCDALSVDALRAALRDADHGHIRRAGPGRAYAFALQVMMIYIGLAYFFPGAWKVARAGARWFTSDNMAGLILAKIHEMPATPLQHWVLGHPTLLWLMAYGTIVFELGFLLAIFDRRSRVAAAIVGLGFHTMTALIMGIRFVALASCYVVFVDWSAGLRRLAARQGLRPITLRYDSADAVSRRLVAIAVSFDWLDLIRPAAITGPVAGAWAVVDDSGRERTEPHAVARSVADRIPLLWPWVRVLGDRAAMAAGHLSLEVARRGGGRQQRAAPPVASSAPVVTTPAPSPALRPAGTALLAACALAGVAHVARGWPIACYPPFDVPEGRSLEMLSIEATDRDGQSRAATLSFDPVMGQRFGTDRWRGLVATVLSADRTFDPARARALIALWSTAHSVPALQGVTLFADRYPLAADDPPDPPDPPVARRLIGTVP